MKHDLKINAVESKLMVESMGISKVKMAVLESIIKEVCAKLETEGDPSSDKIIVESLDAFPDDTSIGEIALSMFFLGLTSYPSFIVSGFEKNKEN